MRQYRGLTKKDGKRVYGWYVKVEDKHYIISDGAELLRRTISNYSTVFGDVIVGFVEVIPESVSQQIGRKDKTGNEIYEGDILKIMTDQARYAGETDKYRQEIATSGCPCGLNTNGMISIKEEGQEEYESQLEIIGTIHTHPELLSERK